VKLYLQSKGKLSPGDLTANQVKHWRCCLHWSVAAAVVTQPCRLELLGCSLSRRSQHHRLQRQKCQQPVETHRRDIFPLTRRAVACVRQMELMGNPPPPPPVGRGSRAAAHREAQALLQSKVAQFKNVLVRASVAACWSALPSRFQG
jgi:hypothetical protein